MSESQDNYYNLSKYFLKKTNVKLDISMKGYMDALQNNMRLTRHNKTSYEDKTSPNSSVDKPVLGKRKKSPIIRSLFKKKKKSSIESDNQDNNSLNPSKLVIEKNVLKSSPSKSVCNEPVSQPLINNPPIIKQQKNKKKTLKINIGQKKEMFTKKIFKKTKKTNNDLTTEGAESNLKLKSPLKKEELISKISDSEKIFSDFELPSTDEFISFDQTVFLPKLMTLIPHWFLNNAIVKVILEEETKLNIKTSNIKPKTGGQKKENIIYLSNNMQLDLEKDPLLIVQEPCLHLIDSEDKFLKVLDYQALSHFSERWDELGNNILWPVFVMQNLGEINAQKIILKRKYEINDDCYLNLENNSTCHNLIKLQRVNDQIEDTKEDEEILIWYFGTNYYESTKVEKIIKFKNVDIEEIKKFFYKNQFLKAIFSDFIRMVKEFNISIEKNINVVINANKFKNFHGRVIKISLKEENFYCILLNSKSTENQQQIFVKRLDNLKFEWLNLNSCSEKPILTSSLNYPSLCRYSYRNLYEKIIQEEQVSSEKLLFSLFEFFHKIFPIEQYEKQRESIISKNNICIFEGVLPELIRCTICNYIGGKLEVWQCLECQRYFHKQCLSQESLHNKGWKNWICDDCMFCQICYNPKNKEDLISCNKCKYPFHKICASPDGTISEENWFCPKCSICYFCNKTKEALKTFENQSICENCFQIQEKKEFCRVCGKPWIKPSRPENKKHAKHWIFCSICNAWIHRLCDSLLKEDQVFSKLSHESCEYYCPPCRMDKKKGYMKDFLTILSSLDQNKYFFIPVDAEKVPYYKKVISEPMDFETMFSKIQNNKYSIDPFISLRRDFDLICDNAMLYNFPKSHIHIEAKKLKIFGAFCFDFFKEELNKPEEDFIVSQKSLLEQEKLFLEQVELCYYDLLFSEGQGNSNIKILQKTKTGSEGSLLPKELILEVKGLNKFLESIRQNKSNKNQDNSSPNKQSPQKMDIESDNSQIIPLSYQMQKLHDKSVWQAIQEMLIRPNPIRSFLLFDPIPLVFSNTHLIEADNCLICGSFANETDILTCCCCSESYHPFCIYSKDYNCNRFIENKTKFNNSWKCPNCKCCDKCGKLGDNYSSLICNGCEIMVHLSCWIENAGSFPGLSWKCDNCFKCSQCGTNKIFNRPVDNIRFEICQDFKYCYQCGMLDMFSHFCRFCKKYISTNYSEKDPYSLAYLSSYQDYLKCTECKFLFHTNCYKEFTQNELSMELENFICPDCELLSQSKLQLEVEKQQNLLKNLTELKQKQEDFKMIFDIVKIIIENSKALNKKYSFDGVHQLFLKDFIILNENYFRNTDFINFKNNLTALCRIETISKAKRIKLMKKIHEYKNHEDWIGKELYIEKYHIFNFYFEINLFQYSFEYINKENQSINFLSKFKKKDSFKDNLQNIIFQKTYKYDKYIDYDQLYIINIMTKYEIVQNNLDFTTLKNNLQLYEKCLLGLQINGLNFLSNEIDYIITPNNYPKSILIRNISDLDKPKTIIEKEKGFDEEMTDLYEKMILEAKIKKNIIKMFMEYEKRPKQQIKPESKQLISLLPEPKKKMLFSIINPTSFDLMNGPLNDLKCELCDLKGERTILGRLLSCEINKYVHVNCALWSSDVYENMEGELLKFSQAFRRSAVSECSYCKNFGATLLCLRHKICKFKFHMTCGLINGCLFTREKTVACKKCVEEGEIEISEKNVVKEFSSERRLFIKEEGNNLNKNCKTGINNFYANDFNRVGNITVLNISKANDNSEGNKPFDEYFIVKKVFDKDNKKRLLLLMFFESKRYYLVNAKFINSLDEIDALKRSNFRIENQEIKDLFEKAIKIEDLYDLWQLLSSMINVDNVLIDLAFDFLSRFLGFNLSIIQFWIKENGESSPLFRKYQKPLTYNDYLYSFELEEINVFQRQKKLQEFYKNLKFKEIKLDFNPKINSLLKSRKDNILENHRKAAEASDSIIKAEELITENILSLPVSEIQFSMKEIEKKLKFEYSTYKQKTKPNVFVGPSKIHKYGLFATETIKKFEIVIEYVGEVVRNVVADLREEIYKVRGFGDCYMFRLDKDFVVDATFNGNQARYLNHSCDHNCGSYILQIGDEKKIIMYAIKEIIKGEEITYDYQFDLEAEKLKCTCGAKNCQGRLN